MRKILGFGAFLGLLALCAPAYAAGFVGIQDPTNPGYVAAVDSTGHLSVTGTVSTITTITNPVGVKGSDGATISTTANPFPVTGVGVAQGSTSSGQTLSPIGCRTLNAPAADTTAQTNMPTCALSGALIIYPYSNPENLVSGLTAAMTGTTSTSIIAAPASGLRNYVTNIVCTNSHATVSTFVIVQDGSGGTTFYEAYAAAVGGGFSINFPAPLRQPTTATALYVQDVTTGANVICSASGFKAP